ncbi:MAG: pseudouridine synthase [Pirellulales bacterium]
MQRINKVLAAAGLGSRRDVEELILQGRVEIDGTTVTNLATRVNPQEAKIEVDGQLLKRPKLVYYALNKPKGVLSTSNDPSGRMRVIDFVPDKHRVFSVGRLDRYSEGLMLLTNDGDLAQRLAHPRFRVQKTYFVVVAGILTIEELAKLRKGVYLAEGMARIDGARIRKTRKTCTELEILLSEGKNREIRRILARAGHKVVLLRRLAIGPLRLAEMPVGAARELTANEIKALYAVTEPKAAPKAKPEAAQEATVVPPVDVTKVVTPIESDGFDDFGVGLDGDYEYDESQLVLTDDVVEFGASTEEEMDDDFVADFESLSAGAVLDYEEDVEEQVDQPPRHRSSELRSDRSGDRRDRDRGNRDGATRGRDGGGRASGRRDGGGRDGSRDGGDRYGSRVGSGSRRGGRVGGGRDRYEGARGGDRFPSRGRRFSNDDNRGQRDERPETDQREGWSEGGEGRSEGYRGTGRSKFGRSGSDRSSFGSSSRRPGSGSGRAGFGRSGSGGRFQSDGRQGSGRYGSGGYRGSGSQDSGSRGGRRPFDGSSRNEGRQQNESFDGDFRELFGDGQESAGPQADRSQGNRGRKPSGGGFGRGGAGRGGDSGRGGSMGRRSSGGAGSRGRPSGGFAGRAEQGGRSRFPRNDQNSGWSDQGPARQGPARQGPGRQGEGRQDFETEGDQRSDERSFGKRSFNRRPGGRQVGGGQVGGGGQGGPGGGGQGGSFESGERRPGKRTFGGGSGSRDSRPGGRPGGRPSNRLGGRPGSKPGKKRPGGPKRDRD